VIRVYDESGNVIETHGHGRVHAVLSFAKQPAAGLVRNLRHRQPKPQIAAQLVQPFNENAVSLSAACRLQILSVKGGSGSLRLISDPF
jgi:hypothetical protein